MNFDKLIAHLNLSNIISPVLTSLLVILGASQALCGNTTKLSDRVASYYLLKDGIVWNLNIGIQENNNIRYFVVSSRYFYRGRSVYITELAHAMDCVREITLSHVDVSSAYIELSVDKHEFCSAILHHKIDYNGDLGYIVMENTVSINSIDERGVSILEKKLSEIFEDRFIMD